MSEMREMREPTFFPIKLETWKIDELKGESMNVEKDEKDEKNDGKEEKEISEIISDRKTILSNVNCIKWGCLSACIEEYLGKVPFFFLSKPEYLTFELSYYPEHPFLDMTEGGWRCILPIGLGKEYYDEYFFPEKKVYTFREFMATILKTYDREVPLRFLLEQTQDTTCSKYKMQYVLLYRWKKMRLGPCHKFSDLLAFFKRFSLYINPLSKKIALDIFRNGEQIDFSQYFYTEI